MLILLGLSEKKITVVVSDVLNLQKEEKVDFRAEQEEESKVDPAMGDAIVADETASVISADETVTSGEEEQLLVTTAQYTTGDSLFDEGLWRRLRTTDSTVQVSLQQFKRIDGLWSNHHSLNGVQDVELKRRIEAAAMDIDSEAVRAAKATIFEKLCCCFCRPSESE
jgi:hypothetical protein